MKKYECTTRKEFEKKCGTGNMPETDEAISCLFCANVKTTKVLSDGMPVEYRRCCNIHNFELCTTISTYHRCDDFESKH